MKLKSSSFFIILSFSFAVLGDERLGHSEHIRHQEEPAKSQGIETQPEADPFEMINSEYRKSVKPIFKAKCFDCHSKQTSWPWYHKVSGIKQLLDKDVNEGLEHMDLTDDFPFGGHGSSQEDLDAIADAVEKSEMPPMKYRLMHWNSKLTNAEKEAVLSWIKSSRETLQRIMGDEPASSDHSGHH